MITELDAMFRRWWYPSGVVKEFADNIVEKHRANVRGRSERVERWSDSLQNHAGEHCYGLNHSTTSVRCLMTPNVFGQSLSCSSAEQP